MLGLMNTKKEEPIDNEEKLELTPAREIPRNPLRGWVVWFGLHEVFGPWLERDDAVEWMESHANPRAFEGPYPLFGPEEVTPWLRPDGVHALEPDDDSPEYEEGLSKRLWLDECYRW